MSYTETIEERGNYRVRLESDDCPHPPENDGGCPVIRITDGRSARFEHTGYGAYFDAGFDVEHVLDQLNGRYGWRKALNMFERYVRIFHEGSVETYNIGVSHEYGYIAFTTRTLVREWGIADDQPVPAAELDEWRAYCEGDVYGYIVEEQVTWQRLGRDGEPTFCSGDPTMETWEEVDSCWGYYGHEYAEQAAREALDGYMAEVA